MASEAISSALFIIGGVVAASVLLSAIFPVIFNAGQTFGTVAHGADEKMRTDFAIVNTFSAYSSTPANNQYAQVWLKNTGSNAISIYDIEKSDVFIGSTSSITNLPYDNELPLESFSITITGGDNVWNIGETVQLDIRTDKINLSRDDIVYFSFVLPNSVRKTITFTKS
ncbi:MAG: hypothetical protein JXA44_08330 [Methanospirillaceae archaeon]|nr:hypothetical protein [Methanospirillaceae archaeon]